MISIIQRGFVTNIQHFFQVKKINCLIIFLLFMISHLANRHYHKINEELPFQLRSEQPKMIYLPSHNRPIQICEPNVAKSSKVKSKKHMAFIQDGLDCCPVCQSNDNISVQYFGKKHVCVKCRKLMRDGYGNQIRIFLDQSGDIVCLGIKPNKNKTQKRIYYHTNYMNLQIQGRSAYATFAGEQQLVLILRALGNKYQD